jgi:hypothetical protein
MTLANNFLLKQFFKSKFKFLKKVLHPSIENKSWPIDGNTVSAAAKLLYNLGERKYRKIPMRNYRFLPAQGYTIFIAYYIKILFIYFHSVHVLPSKI